MSKSNIANQEVEKKEKPHPTNPIYKELVTLEDTLKSMLDDSIQYKFDSEVPLTNFLTELGVDMDDAYGVRFLNKNLRFPMCGDMMSYNIIKAAMRTEGKFATKHIRFESHDAKMTFAIYRNMSQDDVPKELGSYVKSMARYFRSFIVIDNLESRDKGAAEKLVQEFLSIVDDAPVVALAGYLYKGDYELGESSILDKHVHAWESYGFRNVNGLLDSYEESVPMLHCNNSIDKAFNVRSKKEIRELQKIIDAGESVYEYLSKENGYEVVNWFTFV